MEPVGSVGMVALPALREERICPAASVQTPDLEGGQLRPVREDVVLDTLWSQLYIE